MMRTILDKARLWSKTKTHWILIGPPYLWLVIFFGVPSILILKISMSSATWAQPPFSDIANWMSPIWTLRLDVSAYQTLLTDPFYVRACLSSLGIALAATCGCIFVGYPIAYAIRRSSPHLRLLLLMLVMLPFFIAFLVRVYAWMTLLGHNGWVNGVLGWMGLGPYQLLDNAYAVVLGMVYCYLPFMVLPIYATLDHIDETYLEAASDLGSRSWHTFWHITVPLSRSGVISGCLLVMIPAVGEFVIPELLGGPDTFTIGRTVWNEFFTNRHWPLACAIATLMIALFTVPFTMLSRGDKT